MTKKAKKNAAKKPPKLKVKTGRKDATERPFLMPATGGVTKIEIEELLTKANGVSAPAGDAPQSQQAGYRGLQARDIPVATARPTQKLEPYRCIDEGAEIDGGPQAHPGLPGRWQVLRC
jgi:hypothetical protein